MDRQHITVGARRRTFHHIAPTVPRAGAPLLVALHGTTQNGPALRRFSGRTLDDLAAVAGADLVYLDGDRRAWNDARLLKTSAAQKRDVDDVGFIRAVIARFDRPALLVGYSAGGQMVHRFVREIRGLLAGAVVIAAGLPVAEEFALGEVVPDDVPMLLLHGTADPVVPFEGGATRLLGRTRGRVRSAAETAATYAGTTVPIVAEDGRVRRAEAGKVRLVSQAGAGHVVPNRRTAPRFVGPSHADLDVGEEIRSFFAW